MSKLARAIAERRIFFTFWIVIVLLSGVWLFSVSKANSFWWVASWHHPIADVFFRLYTLLGDGIFMLIIALAFVFFKRFASAGFIVVSFLFSGLLVQIGKRILAMPRPLSYFETLGFQVYQPAQVVVHGGNSFPSGHTTTAFALCFCLVLLSKPTSKINYLWLLMAVMVAYSRVYLSQHFPVDVWAGALLGCISALLVFLFFNGKIYGKKVG